MNRGGGSNARVVARVQVLNQVFGKNLANIFNDYVKGLLCWMLNLGQINLKLMTS